MLFVQLEVGWLDSPKIVRADMAMRGVHATSMVLAKRTESDGWFDRVLLTREGADVDLIDRCIDARMLEASGDLLRPHGWLDRNPSQGAIDAIRASKREAAARGNHKRWDHPGEFADCPKCQRASTSDRTSSQDDPTRSPESESDLYLESESESPPPSPQDNTQPDEQTVIRTAVLIGRRIATHDRPGDDGRYAQGVTKRILTEFDGRGDDRLAIAAALGTGQTPEQVADGWNTDPLAGALYPTSDRAVPERHGPRMPEFKGWDAHYETTQPEATAGHIEAARKALATGEAVS